MFYLLPAKAAHFPADAKEACLFFRLTTRSAILMVNEEIAPIIIITLTLQVERRTPEVQRESEKKAGKICHPKSVT